MSALQSRRNHVFFVIALMLCEVTAGTSRRVIWALRSANKANPPIDVKLPAIVVSISIAATMTLTSAFSSGPATKQLVITVSKRPDLAAAPAAEARTN